MTKPELLSPAGNMEALKSAVHNGADAIYLAGTSFGARKFADNFSNNELTEAFNYAHLYGVKVYVTANTIIYDDEVNDFISYITFLYVNGVDAIIMQDIGMISLIRKLIPNLEIHASTQTNNCNDEVLKLYKDLGVTRVVMARELSLNEINSFKTDIEKEVFIHGALCICYSGCCLFSSLNGGRSGNRGECAGPCRLPYTLIKNGNKISTEGIFLLSTKELNTSTQIKEIITSNIQSLKIEGRMKSPEYVGFVTKMYRNLIDNVCLERNDKDLKTLFNREFTEGHLFKKQGNDLMNIKSPNHQGIIIGKVTNINNKIEVKLADNLSQNDGIRFLESNKGMMVNMLYNSKDLLTNKALKGETIYLDNKINLTSNDTVLKTISYELNENLKKYPEKKILVNIKIKAKINNPIIVTINDDKNEVKITGSIIEASITSPITKEKISYQLSKLGNTPFIINNINIDMDDNIFISIKELNILRRYLTDELIKLRVNVDRKMPIINYPTLPDKTKHELKISALVRNENQLKNVLDYVEYIYTDDYNLYLKYKGPKVFYQINRVGTILPDFKNENLLITELGSLYKYSKNNNCHGDYFLNVVNNYSVNFLEQNSIIKTTISPEMDLNKLKQIKTGNPEVIIYGTLELMVMKHCIIKMTEGCKNCQGKFHLQNKNNELFPIINKNCLTHIMHSKKINLIDTIPSLISMGISNFRIELFDEDENTIINIFNSIKKS